MYEMKIVAQSIIGRQSTQSSKRNLYCHNIISVTIDSIDINSLFIKVILLDEFGEVCDLVLLDGDYVKMVNSEKVFMVSRNCYKFIFNNIGIRKVGKFKLRFLLVKYGLLDKKFQEINQIDSELIEVCSSHTYAAKKKLLFPRKQ
ncbi:uncharacterized protein ASCRUDRAFT_78268, partial [Ascoidea rubescens DSM 1968]